MRKHFQKAEDESSEKEDEGEGVLDVEAEETSDNVVNDENFRIASALLRWPRTPSRHSVKGYELCCEARRPLGQKRSENRLQGVTNGIELALQSVVERPEGAGQGVKCQALQRPCAEQLSARMVPHRKDRAGVPADRNQ
ncbi:hypothetical protein LTR37_017203 [Vermiconidia calcicola]|uniref:Uncharacterized protein n=1 Tax=Vermiconidia calcicola TaxID=1690605 RepID=A0ACC3MKQ1_9PEZI|nr:hypothetical protein LTR37_017203 [Vermiconidia calcicola]